VSREKEKREKKMTMSFMQKFWQDESGQDLIEYTLLLAFVALASASLFVSAGSSVSGIWGSASTQLSNAATSAS
jgi:Flp pilus assembly pilin Flp